MVPKTTKKPAANKSSRLSPKICTSKADAKQALINATIKNLDTQPITEITVRDISDKISVAELDQTRLATLPIAMKRLWLVQYLVASGVPADRFVANSKDSFALTFTDAKPK